jgi:hypothetical protein
VTGLPVGPLLVQRKHARAHAALKDYAGHLVTIAADGSVKHRGALCSRCQGGRR